MEKSEILVILNDWNFWNSTPFTGISRPLYLTQLKKLLSTKQVIVVTGPRRAGKSVIMRQLARELMAQGIAKNDILMINFEDPRFGPLDTKLLQKIYETYLEYLHPSQKPTVFLDEIQEVENWEKWVSTFHELNQARLVVSGSNAKLLSSDLSTLLTGRHVDLTVFPLSFEERLAFDSIEIRDPLDLANRRIDIRTTLRDYMEHGSFPQVVLSAEKKQMLLGYFEDVIAKDLIRRFRIRKVEQIKSLARFYLSHAACPVTFSSIEKFLSISADTIEKFSGYFEAAFLFFFLKRFSFKVKEQEKSPRKIYAVDTGLANIVGFKNAPNTGRLAESLVFLKLLRKTTTDTDSRIFYWKDLQHREVDFVVKTGNEIKNVIQVCWNISDPRTKEREIKSLLLAMKELRMKQGTIITEEKESEETVEGRQITTVPLWKWLMQ